MLDFIINAHNGLFYDSNFRMFILLISGVFAGYTLQPVPEWLNKKFNTSYALKYFILFYGILIPLYPFDKQNIIISAIIPGIILKLFSFFRQYK